MINNLIERLEKRENLRETLSSLRSEIKDSENYEQCKEALKDGKLLCAFLKEEDAKTRRNAALLLGDLQIQSALDALILAYKDEKTLFVKGSYLTAVSKLDATQYLDFFKKRLEERKTAVIPDEEKKHASEEIKELGKIIISIEGLQKHTFTEFTKPHEMVLTTNKEQRDVTLREVKELSPAIQRRSELHPLGVYVFSKEISAFADLRSYRELLFPVKIEDRLVGRPDQMAEELLAAGIYEFMCECHKGDAPFYFRIEIKSSEPQVEFTKKLAAAIEKKSDWKLMNSTKDYEFEIRLIEIRDGGYVPFIKLFTMPGKRFSYRKNAVGMSIHPATAAMLVQLAKPYLKEDAQILDPCCGVGTMLIERDICVPAREKYGIDIYGKAIEMGRENADLADQRINFIHRDYLDFRHEYKFDEIITNMPVKGRKTKEEMDAFYAAFFEKSKNILTEDGIIIMYSNEAGFVKKQLRLQESFKLLQEFCIRKKDNFYLFIIGMKG